MKKEINWDSLKEISMTGWDSGKPETKCGGGSKVSENIDTILFMDAIIETYRPVTIVDLGCGDFNWMRFVDLSDAYYLGCDWVFHNDMTIHEADNINFVKCNIAEFKIPSCSIIVCKDVLIHMTNEQTMAVLGNIRKSKSKFLLATSYDVPDNNRVINNYAPLNMEKDPFNMGSPISSLKLKAGKQFNLYKL